MQHTRTPLRLILTAAMTVFALSAIQCSSSTPNPAPTPTPTPTVSVSSVSLSPASVVAGGSATGTVTLSTAAPTGGSTVALTSSATGVAVVPGSVAVNAGTTTAAFTITAVAAGTAVITATLNASATATLTVTSSTVTPPPASVALLGISLGATTVEGGQTVTGAATLTGPAPAGGAVVTLTWGDPIVAPTPTSVIVAAGQSTATFTVSTRAAGGTIPTTISGSYGGVTASAALSVTAIPPALALQSLTLNPTIIDSGASSTGTVTLDVPAPAGGVQVALSSNQPSVATVPSGVIVPGGSTTATFNIATAQQGALTTVTISATLVDTKTANLLLNPVVPVARFTVSGASGVNACKLTGSGNGFDCTFDATASSAFGTIQFYDWTYTIAGTKTETVSTAVLNPTPDCSLLPSPLPPGATSLNMAVTLRVRDGNGNTSAPATSNVRLLSTTGTVCGF